MTKHYLLIIITCALGILVSTSVLAKSNPPDLGSYEVAATSFTKFPQVVGQMLSRILSDQHLFGFAMTLWKFFVVMQMTWLMIQYAMGGLNIHEVSTSLFMMLLTRALLLQYDTLTMALWGWSESFAQGLQVAFTGDDSNIFSLSHYIWKAIQSIGFIGQSLFNPTMLFARLVTSLAVVVLSILASLASIWGLWGYALAKMIGFMFLPCMMFERLSWLFDGWCRFFMGFLLYNIIARANLILVVISVQNYLHTPTHLADPLQGYMISLQGIYDSAGFLTLLVLGIYAFFTSGQFVRAIIGGSVVRMSGSARAAARGVSHMVAGLKGHGV